MIMNGFFALENTLGGITDVGLVWPRSSSHSVVDSIAWLCGASRCVVIGIGGIPNELRPGSSCFDEELKYGFRPPVFRRDRDDSYVRDACKQGGDYGH